MGFYVLYVCIRFQWNDIDIGCVLYIIQQLSNVLRQEKKYKLLFEMLNWTFISLSRCDHRHKQNDLNGTIEIGKGYPNHIYCFAKVYTIQTCSFSTEWKGNLSIVSLKVSLSTVIRFNQISLLMVKLMWFSQNEYYL